VAKRQTLLDPVLVSGMNGSAATQATAPFGALGLHEVSTAGTQTKYLSAGGNLEPLGCGFLGLNAFWTSHKSSAFFQKERAI
jgi:hypothetical protein